jgi:hypothetical protein
MPDTFYFHYGRALTGAGSFEKGREMVERYLTKAGANGKFYQEALVEMNNIDAAITSRDARVKAERAAAREADERKAAKIAAIQEKYNAAQLRYAKQLDACPAEFQEYRASLQEAKDRAWQRCADYNKYGCRDGMNPPSAKVVLDAAEAASRRLNNTSYSSTDWCNDRYTAPRKPAELN